MKAILLAAGYGTRLRPLTNTIPKCLLPVKGKPLLQIWVDNLLSIGVKKILINTHYLHEQVEDFFQKYDYKNIVELSYEKELLGTAGTLMKNIDFLGEEDGFLIHSDNYSLEDLHHLQIAHQQRPYNTLLTMMTFKTNIPEQCGIVELDEHSIVKGFHEKVKNPPGNLANGAVYLMSSEFLKDIKKNHLDKLDFSCEILNKYLGKIFTFETKEIFIDIGTIANYEFVNKIGNINESSFRI